MSGGINVLCSKANVPQKYSDARILTKWQKLKKDSNPNGEPGRSNIILYWEEFKKMG